MKIFFAFFLSVFSFISISSDSTGPINHSYNNLTFLKQSSGVNIAAITIPGNNVIQIRHRSPEEVDPIAVPQPSERINYTITTTDSTPEYFAKWKTYFHVELETLPEDQASPLAHSLRAPPVSC